jgi:hypothetical protein
VVSGPTKDGAYYCRYWRQSGIKHIWMPPCLRTKANSELTPARYLHVLDTVPQEFVESAIERWVK